MSSVSNYIIVVILAIIGTFLLLICCFTIAKVVMRQKMFRSSSLTSQSDAKVQKRGSKLIENTHGGVKHGNRMYSRTKSPNSISHSRRGSKCSDRPRSNSVISAACKGSDGKYESPFSPLGNVHPEGAIDSQQHKYVEMEMKPADQCSNVIIPAMY